METTGTGLGLPYLTKDNQAVFDFSAIGGTNAVLANDKYNQQLNLLESGKIGQSTFDNNIGMLNKGIQDDYRNGIDFGNTSTPGTTGDGLFGIGTKDQWTTGLGAANLGMSLAMMPGQMSYMKKQGQLLDQQLDANREAVARKKSIESAFRGA
jgi:hypothetical protein